MIDIERRRVSKKAYYEKNKAYLLARQKARYAEKRDEILNQQKSYRQRNASRISEYNRSEKGREKWRKYDSGHREERKAKAFARRKATPGYAYSVYKRYVSRHPEAKQPPNPAGRHN